jgi:hypothetical protein
MMTRSRLPLVSYNPILRLDEAENQPVPVLVGTDAWYTWLRDQHIQSFSFRHPLGTFTVRRERKRQSWYWYAYRKCAGRLRKAYLGETEELTLDRLNAAAALIGQANNENGPQTSLDKSNRNASQTYSDIVDGKGFFLRTPTSTLPYPKRAGANPQKQST